MEIKVNMKSMGKRKQTVKPVVYHLPLEAGNTFTVRQLVTELKEALGRYQEYVQRMYEKFPRIKKVH